MFHILFEDDINNFWATYYPPKPTSVLPISTPMPAAPPANGAPPANPTMENGGTTPIPEYNNTNLPDPSKPPAQNNVPTPFNPIPAEGGTMIIGVVEPEKDDKVTFEEVTEMTLQAFNGSKDKDGKASINKILNSIDDMVAKKNIPNKPEEKKEEKKEEEVKEPKKDTDSKDKK